MEPYRRLQSLVASLQPLQEIAEGAAPHLVDHVTGTSNALRDRITKHFSEDFEKTLKKLYWPKAEISVPPGLQQEWEKNIGRLLDLQRPELEAGENANRNNFKKDSPSPLLPLEVMVRPLELRFQYHFSGDRPTNRLDKPEYFLSHILDLLSTYSAFFQTHLQPLLLSHFRTSELAFVPAYIDATSAFITALLPLLQRKLTNLLPQVASQPNLFSNLIHEVILFDATLVTEWNYTPLTPSTPYRGLSHYILNTLSYYDRWLAVERDFALSRYDSIIQSADAFTLDYDTYPTSTKPTHAAIRVNDLLETITDRYRPLSSFSQRLKFITDVQLDIFDAFYRRLHGGLEAYLTQTSTLSRAVTGITAADRADLAGIKGIERLCRIYGSAEYLERKMQDWSDDVFFVDMWEEWQYRLQSRIPIGANLNMKDVVAKTSAAANAADDEVQGALFDETAAAYRRLRVRSENVLVEALTSAVRDALRPYARINPWASLSSASAGAEAAAAAALTAELDAPMTLADEYLAFLSKALGPAPLRRVARAMALSLQAYLWDHVVLRYRFSTGGARQLDTDFRALCAVFDRWVGVGYGGAAMRRLAEGIVVLTLPVKGEIPVEVKEGDEGGKGEIEKTGRKMGLWEVERRIFMDNESARDVLEELGLEVLTEHDARDVLQRRVELGS